MVVVAQSFGAPFVNFTSRHPVVWSAEEPSVTVAATQAPFQYSQVAA